MIRVIITYLIIFLPIFIILMCWRHWKPAHFKSTGEVLGWAFLSTLITMGIIALITIFGD